MSDYPQLTFLCDTGRRQLSPGCVLSTAQPLSCPQQALSVLSDPTNFIQTLGLLGQTVEFSTFSLDRGQPFSESIIYLKLQDDC